MKIREIGRIEQIARLRGIASVLSSRKLAMLIAYAEALIDGENAP